MRDVVAVLIIFVGMVQLAFGFISRWRSFDGPTGHAPIWDYCFMFVGWILILLGCAIVRG